MLWLFLYIAHIFYFQQLMLFEFTVKKKKKERETKGKVLNLIISLLLFFHSLVVFSAHFCVEEELTAHLNARGEN